MSEILHISLVPSQLACPMGALSQGRFPGVLVVASFVPRCGPFKNSGFLFVTNLIDLIED